MDNGDTAGGLRRRGSTICRSVYRNFTVPCDDANFDPPKFARWTHKSELFSVYAASCLLFIPTGLWLIFLASACTNVCYSGSVQYVYATPIEGILYVLVGVTSLHGDVIYLGKESYWHVADRILAQTLIMANALLLYIITAADVYLGFVVFACSMLPTMSYYHSYVTRDDYDLYTACHTMWHVTASLNKGIIGYLATLIPASRTNSFDVGKVYSAVGGVLFAEFVLCSYVWARPKRKIGTADPRTLVEQ